MRMTVELFRQEARKRKRGRRRGAMEYPAELRGFAVAFAREAMEAGGSRGAAARDLGLSQATLAKWLDEKEGAAVPAFREVVMEPAATAPGPLVLVAPGGLRVEGLDVEGAAALLGRLR